MPTTITLGLRALCRLAVLRLCLAVAACVLAVSAAQAAKRVALVIGNGTYQNVPRLANAVNDATATRRVLEEAGFEIVPAIDATLAGLRSSVSTFVAKVQQEGAGTTALVYYAGHAVQSEGTNYLLPVDIRPDRHSQVSTLALSLNDILRRLDEVGATAKVILLDACRNNPFATNEMARGLALPLLDGAQDEPRSEAGLARIESKSGTFVAFSTSPGAIAFDGGGENSPFTDALLKLIRERGLPLEQLFRRVRLAVHDATGGRQTPWETSSLTTDFRFFDGAPASAPGTPAVTRPGAPVGAAIGTSPGSLATRPSSATFRGLSPADGYRVAVSWDRPDVYRAYLDAQPDDAVALPAHRLLSLRMEEIAWAETVRAGDAESFAAFARIYRGSSHLAEALRLATTAPSRNQARVAASCPVPTERGRRTDIQLPLRAAPVRQAPRPNATLGARGGGPRLSDRGRDGGRPGDAPPAQPPGTPTTTLLPEIERWTRFYVGIHGGYARQDGRLTTGGFGPTNSVPTSIEAGNVPRSLRGSSDGGIGGGQAGFNWTLGPVLVGVEADIAYTGLGRRSTVAVNPFGVLVTTSAEQRLDYLGTARARLGLVFGDLALFGTAGLGYGGVEQSAAIVPSPAQNPTYRASRSDVAVGWTVGGGGEYAIGPQVSLKVDYLHYDLGSRRTTLAETTGLAPGEFATIRGATRGDVVRTGINFGF